jgi:sugar phosphate isomerase/epimerase
VIELGFASAILPDLPFEKVFEIAGQIGFRCVETMCWPPVKAERRYSGITHININECDESHIANIKKIQAETKVSISALGYYPNCLSSDAETAETAVAHLKRLIEFAPKLGINRVNTFIGRNEKLSVDDNWPLVLKTWKPIVDLAEKVNVKIGIENCPMFFSKDEWPGGKNIAHSPKIWSRLFGDLGSPNLGLNYDPSHLVWQQMDYLLPLTQFADRIFHVHAKDVRIDYDKLNQVGILANPNEYHTPKLPGLGSINWGNFFSVLLDSGYRGPVCVEVEDRAYEGSLETRIDSLRQSHCYLKQFACFS